MISRSGLDDGSRQVSNDDLPTLGLVRSHKEWNRFRRNAGARDKRQIGKSVHGCSGCPFSIAARRAGDQELGAEGTVAPPFQDQLFKTPVSRGNFDNLVAGVVLDLHSIRVFDE